MRIFEKKNSKMMIINLIRGYKASTLLLFASLLILSCKNKQQEVKEVVTDQTIQTKDVIKSTETVKKTILCFGNSLTAGYGLDEKEAWPSLLNMRLDSLKLGYKTVNAGISGETSSGGLNRIDWVLNQKVDVFILELGANDMLRGLDINVTEINLRQILKRVHAKYPGIPIVIAGMLAPPNMGVAYEKQFSGIFKKLANEFNGKLIPFFLANVAGIENLNLPDRLHPNAQGQKIVLENVWEQLKEVL